MNITLDGHVWEVRELHLHGQRHALLVRMGIDGHRIVRLLASDALGRLDACIAWLESILADWSN